MPVLVEPRGIELIWHLPPATKGILGLGVLAQAPGRRVSYAVHMTGRLETAADVVHAAIRRVGRDAFARGGNHFLKKLPVFV